MPICPICGKVVAAIDAPNHHFDNSYIYPDGRVYASATGLPKWNGCNDMSYKIPPIGVTECSMVHDSCLNGKLVRAAFEGTLVEIPDDW